MVITMKESGVKTKDKAMESFWLKMAIVSLMVYLKMMKLSKVKLLIKKGIFTRQ